MQLFKLPSILGQIIHQNNIIFHYDADDTQLYVPSGSSNANELSDILGVRCPKTSCSLMFLSLRSSYLLSPTWPAIFKTILGNCLPTSSIIILNVFYTNKKHCQRHTNSLLG